MTAYQYSTLKYLVNHEVTVTDAGTFSMVTFGSLLVRGWITRSGNKLVLTTEGDDAYNAYSRGTANFRKVDTGITDRVKGLMHLNNVRSYKTTGVK
jgi:outer membrane receptor for Fe3+-dicitrate